MHHPEEDVVYPAPVFRLLDAGLLRLEHAAAAVGVLGLAAIMLLVSADALGRYFFNAPVQFQYELTSHYIMGMTSLVALSWGVRRGAHIRIGFIDQVVGERLRGILFGINFLIAAVTMAVICVYAAGEAWHAWVNADLFFGVVDWPVWLARIWVPLGCGLLCLRLVLDGVMVLIDPQHARVLGTSTDPDTEVDAV
ncbi:TRAP transporter small permease [Roseospira goensis]|uniref:TRAP transporter small permease protein n=1 Tax=Roseospira goensis TaxID=391922 RepID=A0A7W6WKQ6_9PROT|nr:TRAP transporter small permease [Roseospira goensis]MBB4285898.1 TRAP-type C4-dicarboxylate transport system permease small subunit [Roseospira goensis]